MEVQEQTYFPSILFKNTNLKSKQNSTVQLDESAGYEFIFNKSGDQIQIEDEGQKILSQISNQNVT